MYKGYFFFLLKKDYYYYYYHKAYLHGNLHGNVLGIRSKHGIHAS